MMPQGWTLPSELDKIPGYLAAWEKRPSWENTYYTVAAPVAAAPLHAVPWRAKGLPADSANLNVCVLAQLS